MVLVLAFIGVLANLVKLLAASAGLIIFLIVLGAWLWQLVR